MTELRGRETKLNDYELECNTLPWFLRVGSQQDRPTPRSIPPCRHADVGVRDAPALHQWEWRPDVVHVDMTLRDLRSTVYGVRVREGKRVEWYLPEAGFRRWILALHCRPWLNLVGVHVPA